MTTFTIEQRYGSYEIDTDSVMDYVDSLDFHTMAANAIDGADAEWDLEVENGCFVVVLYGEGMALGYVYLDSDDEVDGWDITTAGKAYVDDGGPCCMGQAWNLNRHEIDCPQAH